MATTQNLITVIPDRFSAAEMSAVDQSKEAIAYGQGGKGGVRRPTRGITLKKDSFASIRVLRAGRGAPITLVDAGAPPTPEEDSAKKASSRRRTSNYTNFLLQQVQEERAEKNQILETFGEPFIFLFGERPRIMSFSGVLMNTFDFNWTAEWWYNYDNYLRGTKCVENDARVFLTFDEVVVSGYILSATSTNTATDPYTVPFQFQMFVTSYSNFSRIGDPSADQGFEGGIPIDWTLTSSDREAALKVFRPTLIPLYGLGDRDGSENIVSYNKLNPSTLEYGFKSALKAVRKRWTGIRDTILTSTRLISDRLNQGGVQIPVGYAGATEFDSPYVELRDSYLNLSKASQISYTTFFDNKDEYVVGGDEYSASFVKFDNIGRDPDREAVYNNKLVERVTQEWKKNGKFTNFSDTQLGSVSSYLLAKQAGVQLVGVNKYLSVPHKVVASGKDLLARFANSLPNPYGVMQDPSSLNNLKVGVPGSIGVSSAKTAVDMSKQSLESKL